MSRGQDRSLLVDVSPCEATTHSHYLCLHLDSSISFTVMECADLSPPENGDIMLTGTTVGSTASYKCKEGYVLDGDGIRTCMNNETWSGNPPLCKTYSSPDEIAIGCNRHNLTSQPLASLSLAFLILGMKC